MIEAGADMSGATLTDANLGNADLADASLAFTKIDPSSWSLLQADEQAVASHNLNLL